MGISPDIIVARCDEPLEDSIRQKISLFCNVKPDCVIENMTLPVLYQAPIMLENSKLSDIVCRELNLNLPPADLSDWNDMLTRITKRNKVVKIALVGKYVKLHDAYLSVMEALYHAGYENGAEVAIQWTDAENVTESTMNDTFADCDGILVPGGFGTRGIEGKLLAAKYAREHDIPYLGICLGMQTAVIEFARNVLKIPDANSSEFEPAGKHSVIDLMPDQHGNLPKGGTMRLGAYPCHIRRDSIMERAYGKEDISERHRHRYEFNNDYREQMEQAGLRITGTSPDKRLVEAVELPDKRFFIGVQFHPEFKSRPNRAHPLFYAFLKESLAKNFKRASHPSNN